MKATGIVRRIDDPGPGGHSQGDPPHYAHPRGRPVTDDIGTVAAFQLRHAGSGKTARLELIHNVGTARLMSFA